MTEGPVADHGSMDLRAPVSGAGALDPRTSLLLWGGGSVVLGVVITFLLVRGEFRMLVLLLLGVMGLVCISPLRGVFLLTSFLPFMYLIRRSVLVVQEFSQRDPILVFPVVATLAMAASALVFYTPTIFYYLKRSLLLKACVALILLFAVQMVNPLQGSLLVGLAGGMFFIVPVLWFFAGLLLQEKHIRNLLVLVLVIGCVTSIYGIYQHFFGLSRVEIYELRSKHFLKAFEGQDNVRVMATFSGLADFARYLAVSGFITFAYFWKNKRSLYLLVLFGIQMWAMLYTAVRTSFLVTLFSMVILLTLTGSNARRIAFRAAMATLFIVLLYAYSYRFDPQSVYRQEFSTNPFLVHTMSGMTHPTQEGSFQSRLSNWGYVVRSTLTEHPWGRGLGSTTTAAKKFSGGRMYETDSFFFELFYGSSILAPPIFIMIVWYLVKSLMRLSLTMADPFVYRVILSLMAGILLSSIFGITVRDNIVGPFAWLLIGWSAKAAVDAADAAAAPAAAIPEAGA